MTKYLWIIVLLLLSLIVAGCSRTEPRSEESEAPTETDAVAITDLVADQNTYMGDHVTIVGQVKDRYEPGYAVGILHQFRSVEVLNQAQTVAGSPSG